MKVGPRYQLSLTLKPINEDTIFTGQSLKMIVVLVNILIRGSPITVRGPTQHMVETVDNILLILIFTFMIHVSFIISISILISYYPSIRLSILPPSLTIHLAPTTQYSFYTERSCAKTVMSQSLSFPPNASCLSGRIQRF